MQHLASRLWSPTSRFHPGQLAWNRHCRDVDPARPGAGEAIALWSEADGAVAFGWAESADWLELQVDPDHPELAEEVIDWFEGWSDAETQSAHVMQGDVCESALAAAGFAPAADRPFFAHHVLDLAALPEPPTVAGCALRPVRPTDVAARAACHRAAWADVGPSELTTSAYESLRSAWPYDPRLDWVAVDESGAMVASCLVWLDPDTGVGLVEPVGTVPSHRGRGLAGAVVLAALHRLRDLGGVTAQVSPRGDSARPGPMRLYRSLGFRPTGRTVTWTRSLD